MILLGVLRFISFCLLIICFILNQIVAILIIGDENKRLKYFLKSIRFASTLGLKILNVEHSIVSQESSNSGRLIISNHISYLDVLILSVYFPSLFVTSVEMKEVPVLGHITKLAGCFFVERRKQKRGQDTIVQEISDINKKLNLGFDVFLFPEGTSSDGKSILPFKSTFFQSAIDCKAGILPLCLKYQTGMNVVPWYGKMTFPDHLFRLCIAGGVKAKINVLDVVKPDATRTELKSLCYERMLFAYDTN